MENQTTNNQKVLSQIFEDVEFFDEDFNADSFEETDGDYFGMETGCEFEDVKSDSNFAF